MQSRSGDRSFAADRLLDALADPTRRRVVQLLGERPHRAGELARELGTSPPVMSRHLRTLSRAGFVDDERGQDDARQRIFRLRPESVVALQAWLDQLQAQWNDQLAAFARHVEREHLPGPTDDDTTELNEGTSP